MFKKCGFLTITGFPNSGKSTFINNVINKKISIISSKVQTTKDEIKGILNFNKNQFIFLDTPGIINNRKFYNKDMSRAIFNSIDRVSCNLFIYDPMKTINKRDIKIIENLLDKFKKNILVINKIDLIKKENLLEVSNQLNKLFTFQETFMVSAKKKKGLEIIIKKLEDYIPKRNWIYKESVYTDSSMKFQLTEITREKIFQLLNKEIPYSVNIKTSINEKKAIFHINQKIFTNKESQKAIIIGKDGKKIKEIGIRARKDIEKKLNKKVFLDLSVVFKNNKKNS